MGQTRAQKIIKQLDGSVQRKTPIATDMFIPNHSGEHTAGRTGTPTADRSIVNKSYVDTLLTNKPNWDTAYGWGDHSAAGYVTLAGAQTITGAKTFTGGNGSTTPAITIGSTDYVPANQKSLGINTVPQNHANGRNMIAFRYDVPIGDTAKQVDTLNVQTHLASNHANSALAFNGETSNNGYNANFMAGIGSGSTLKDSGKIGWGAGMYGYTGNTLGSSTADADFMVNFMPLLLYDSTFTGDIGEVSFFHPFSVDGGLDGDSVTYAGNGTLTNYLGVKIPVLKSSNIDPTAAAAMVILSPNTGAASEYTIYQADPEASGAPNIFQSLTRFGGTTNYTELDTTGFTEAYGTAKAYRDTNIAGYLLTRPSSSQPDVVSFVDEDGTDTDIETYGFDVGEKVHGGFELQHDYAEGTNIVFHVHWQGITAPSGTDNVQWRLKYIVMRDGTTLNAATTIDSPDTPFDTQYESVRSDFAAITGTNFKIGDQLMFTLTRVTATGDAYGGDALIATAGIHYQVNTIGSRTITTK